MKKLTFIYILIGVIGMTLQIVSTLYAHRVIIENVEYFSSAWWGWSWVAASIAVIPIGFLVKIFWNLISPVLEDYQDLVLCREMVKELSENKKDND